MLNLKEILRASHVRRWNIVATSRDQSVAEHQYNVCMIVRAMCKKLGRDDVALMKAALEHDLDEVVFGDIPSPMKAKMKKDGVDINAYVSNTMRELSLEEELLLKVADLLDAYLFINDHGIGAHANKVRDEVFIRLQHKVEEVIFSPQCSLVNQSTVIRNFIFGMLP